MKDVWVVTAWTAKDNTTEVLMAFDSYHDGFDYAESVAEGYSCKRVDGYRWDSPSKIIRMTNVERRR